MLYFLLSICLRSLLHHIPQSDVHIFLEGGNAAANPDHQSESQADKGAQYIRRLKNQEQPLADDEH